MPLNSQTLNLQVLSQVETLSPTVDTAFTLPSAANMVGKLFTFINSGTANILVKASDASLVRTVYPGTSGQVTPNIDSPSTASHWEGVGKVTSNRKLFNVTMDGITSYGSGGQGTGMWWRDGQHAFIDIEFIFGTSPTGSRGWGFDFSTNLGLTLDISKFPNDSGGRSLCGTLYSLPASNNYTMGGLTAPGSGNSIGARLTGSSSLYTLTSPYTWGNTDRVMLNASVPIVGWTATKG